MNTTELPMAFVCTALIACFSANYEHKPTAQASNSKPISAALSKPELPSNGRVVQAKQRVVEAKVTAYCPCFLCCGTYSGEGKTSRGRDARKTRGVAVDPKAIAYGSNVTIPGYGTFIADDTGGAMRQSWKKGIVHIDLRFHDHKEALKFGVKHLQVIIN